MHCFPLSAREAYDWELEDGEWEPEMRRTKGDVMDDDPLPDSEEHYDYYCNPSE